MLTSSSAPTNKPTLSGDTLLTSEQPGCWRKQSLAAPARDIHCALYSHIAAAARETLFIGCWARRESEAKLDLFSLCLKTTAKFQQQSVDERLSYFYFYFCEAHSE
jgi:hypothetical protein